MDDDEAAFFARPKKRIPDVLRKKRKRDSCSTSKNPKNATIAAQEISSDSDADSDSSESDESKSKTKSALPRSKTNEKDRSTTTGEDLTVNLSSDTEDDRSQSTTARIPVRRSRLRTRATTPPRSKRSKSDSLTPPPQLTAQMKEAGTQFVQDVFRPLTRPLLFTESIELEQNEAERIFEEQMRQRSFAESGSATAEIGDSTGHPPERTKGLRRSESVQEPIPDTILEVVIRGIYVDLPSSSQLIPDIQLWEKPRLFRIRLNTKISIAKIAFCKEAGLCSVMPNGQKVVDPAIERKQSEIVLVYRKVRVFDNVATPYGLGIRDGEQPCFEAHTKEGWQYLENNPIVRASLSTTEPVLPLVNDDDVPVLERSSHTPAPKPAAEEGDGGDQVSGRVKQNPLKFTIRAQDGKELKVRTLPTTRISKIIEGFKMKYMIAEDLRMGLFLDDEQLSGILGETDVEMDDVIDLRIL